MSEAWLHATQEEILGLVTTTFNGGPLAVWEVVDHWLKTARAGDRLIYHTGCLMADRQINDDLDDGARRLMWEATNGRVELTQRRLTPDQCEYHARKVR